MILSCIFDYKKKIAKSITRLVNRKDLTGFQVKFLHINILCDRNFFVVLGVKSR